MGEPLAKVAFLPYAATKGAYDIGKAAYKTINPDDPPALGEPEKAPPPPDVTDETVQKARLAVLRRGMGGSGLPSTSLTGPLGDPSAVSTTKPSATGV